MFYVYSMALCTKYIQCVSIEKMAFFTNKTESGKITFKWEAWSKFGEYSIGIWVKGKVVKSKPFYSIHESNISSWNFWLESKKL